MKKILRIFVAVALAGLLVGVASAQLTMGGTASLTLGSSGGGGSMTWPTYTGLTAYGGVDNWVTPTYGNVVSLWTSCTAGYLKFDGSCSTPAGGAPGGTTGAMQYNNAGALGGLNGTCIPYLNGASAPTCATTSNVQGVIGSGVYDAAGAAAAALTSAEAFSSNASNLASGTVPVGLIPNTVPVAGDVTGTTGATTVAKVNGAAVPASINGAATNASGQFIPQTAGGIQAILGLVPVGAPVFTGDLATGVLADYDMSQGSGTTVLDGSGANACSGSPCNGTFGAGSATAPAWNGNISVSFTAPSNGTGTQGISLPATLNTTKSFIIAYYVNPISSTPGGVVNGNGYEPLLSASTGSAGLNIIQGAPCSSSTGRGISEFIVWNGNCITTPVNFGAAFHILAYVCGVSGTSLDHMYIDGVESAYYAQGATCGVQTSGNLYLGTSNVNPWNSQGGTFQIFKARFFSTQLTASDVAMATQIFNRIVQSRGVVTTNAPQNIALPILHCSGDSQTQGFGVTTPFCNELTLTNQPAYAIYNWGIGGMTLQGMASADPVRLAPLCATNLGTPSVVNIFGGTNDASQNSTLTSAAWAKSTFQNLAGDIGILHRAGCIVFVSTMLSRYGTDGFGNTFDADSVAYNQLIRQGAVAAGAAGITDWDNPLIQAVGAAPSAGNTYFQSGGLHLTQAGTNIQAALMSGVLNYYFGTTAGNPTLPTATYSMTNADRFLSTRAVTSAPTLTLPECQGVTGAVYTIDNPQSAYVVSIKNLSSTELVNGIDYSSTAYTMPSNTTHTFTAVALPQAVSGCVWSMR